MYAPATVVRRMRHGSVVSEPKASRFMKLPQRPTNWPTNRPMTTRSVMAKNLNPFSPLRRLRHSAMMTTVMTVP